MRLPGAFVVERNVKAKDAARADVRVRTWHPGAWRLLWAAIGDLLPVRSKALVVARIVASELARPAERWLMARGVATDGMVRRAVDRAEKEADGE